MLRRLGARASCVRQTVVAARDGSFARQLREVSILASAGSWLGLPPWTFGVDNADVWLNGFGWETDTRAAGDPAVRKRP